MSTTNIWEDILIGLLACFIPLFICFFVLLFKFKLKITHLLLAILFGLIAILPISFIQYFIPDFKLFFTNQILGQLIKSFLLYGFIEEIFKMLFLLPLTKNKTEIKDFLLIALMLGLSLGCFETAVYYFDHLNMATTKGASLLYGQIFVRIFTADIIHIACSILNGLFVYSIKSNKKKVSILVMSILIHGIYDFFAGFQGGFKIFSIFVVLLAIIECRVKYKLLTEDEV
ncbi:MAG: PrsW family intramembrane metalloprotease [Treponema bryantii]|nr:PrsW family intramembrane metalloprotease [Treponema bryantii]